MIKKLIIIIHNELRLIYGQLLSLKKFKDFVNVHLFLINIYFKRIINFKNYKKNLIFNNDIKFKKKSNILLFLAVEVH